jgi:hypothetical protein
MAVLTSSLQGHLATDPLSKCSSSSIAGRAQTSQVHWCKDGTLFLASHIFTDSYGDRMIFMFLNLEGRHTCSDIEFCCWNISMREEPWQLFRMQITVILILFESHCFKTTRTATANRQNEEIKMTLNALMSLTLDACLSVMQCFISKTGVTCTSWTQDIWIMFPVTWTQ